MKWRTFCMMDNLPKKDFNDQISDSNFQNSSLMSQKQASKSEIFALREMNSTLMRTEKTLIEEKEKRIEGAIESVVTNEVCAGK